MRIFLDANILISVLNKEYPLFAYSSRVLSLCDHRHFEVYTSPLCLAITWYFAEKKSGRTAREKIALLSQKIRLTQLNEQTVQHTIANKRIHDLEDGMQYYSAIDSGCKCIVTEDKKDFYFSEIAVMSSQQFLETHVF